LFVNAVCGKSKAVNPKGFFAELKRRNVIRSAILYVGAVWALAQGISQLGPSVGAPEWATRWFLVAAAIGFPFWIVFAWFYEFTSEGLKRETETVPAESIARRTGRKLDFAIISVLAVALVLLLTDRFVLRHGINETTVTPVAEKSIAVLPFENLSEEKQNEYFADGVQDEILTDLAKIADLKVISRTSVMPYKSGARRNLREIGQQLGVAHVVEGSVQRSANTIRINAQLIDARTDAHLWAQTFDRDLVDVFAIQSEIAKAIADQLQAKLSPNEKKAIEQPPTTDLAAFDLYTRAKTLVLSISFGALHRQSLFQAADLLNEALKRDPNFFQSYCLLVFTEANIYFFHDHSQARLTLVQAALQAAFRLRPNAGETHLARAQYLYYGHRDYESALAELQIARASLPNDPRPFEIAGYIRRRQGRWDEVLPNLQRALELDPRNFFTLQQTALTYGNLRRYAEMATTLDRALSIKPDDPETRAARGMVELDWKADTRPLRKAIDQIRAKDSDATKNVADYYFTLALAERDDTAASDALTALAGNYLTVDTIELSRHFCEGLVARMTKNDAKAVAAFSAALPEQEKRVQAQREYGPALCVLALIEAGLGRKEDALRESRRAVELLPVESDSLNGFHMIEYSAVAAAWVGEKDLACEELTRVNALPGYGISTYGQLKVSPFWDPLRGDPRFEKIVASLAPKP
jgi:TolB-like protein/Tfp pilus assembly protein PilF